MAPTLIPDGFEQVGLAERRTLYQLGTFVDADLMDRLSWDSGSIFFLPLKFHDTPLIMVCFIYAQLFVV